MDWIHSIYAHTSTSWPSQFFFLLIFDYVSAIDARHDWQNLSSTGLAVAHLDPPSSKSARPRPLLNMPKCACEQPTLVDCATTRCDAPCNLSIGLVRSPASSVALPTLVMGPQPYSRKSKKSAVTRVLTPLGNVASDNPISMTPLRLQHNTYPRPQENPTYVTLRRAR